MKITYRIPTEQYAYVEVEENVPFKTTTKIKENYDDLASVFKPQEGLPDKLWRQAIDQYLREGDCEADVYAAMSQEQKRVIQEIKRSMNRINSREK